MFIAVLVDIYSEIYTTLQKIQDLDNQFNMAKFQFQLDLERNYEEMADNLVSQCLELSKEKEEYSLKSQSSQGNHNFFFSLYYLLLICTII